MLGHLVRALPDFQFYGFEVNSRYFAESAAELQRRYANIVSLNFSAVSDYDGTATFRVAGQRRGILRAEATTIVAGFHEDQFIQETLYEVPAIDFSRWVKEMVARHTEENGSKPFVVLKMDIEGAEYAVLEELVRDGTMKLISELLVEFHTEQFDHVQRPHYARREASIRNELSHFPVQVLEWG
jgi:FkbM family methyltransferase